MDGNGIAGQKNADLDAGTPKKVAAVNVNITMSLRELMGEHLSGKACRKLRGQLGLDNDSVKELLAMYKSTPDKVKAALEEHSGGNALLITAQLQEMVDKEVPSLLRRRGGPNLKGETKAPSAVVVMDSCLQGIGNPGPSASSEMQMKAETKDPPAAVSEVFIGPDSASSTPLEEPQDAKASAAPPDDTWAAFHAALDTSGLSELLSCVEDTISFVVTSLEELVGQATTTETAS